MVYYCWSSAWARSTCESARVPMAPSPARRPGWWRPGAASARIATAGESESGARVSLLAGGGGGRGFSRQNSLPWGRF